MLNVLLALVLLQQPAKADEKPKLDEKKVEALVEKCGSEEIADREAATGELFAMGEAVLPLLEKAMGAAKGETRARLEKVVAELTLPARWAKEVIEGDPNQGYQRLENALRSKELDKTQAARVLMSVMLNDSAAPEVRGYMVQLAHRHRIRDVWPALIQLMTKEDSGYENYSGYLSQLRPPKEAAPVILKLIPKVQNYNTAYQMLELARSLKPERAAMEECLSAILDGDDMNLKNNVTGMISQGRVAVSLKTLLKWWREQPSMRMYQLREAVLRTPPGADAGEVVDLFKTGQAEDATLAVEYIGRQKVASAAPALAKMLDDRPELRAQIIQSFRTLRCEDDVRKWISGTGGPGRRAAIALVTELGWSSAGPELTKCFLDEDASVRREAATAAGALRIAEAAPKLEGLLKDGDGGVRRAALVSLAIIQRKDATKAVLTHLRSEDPDLQAAAVESLPYVDAEQALAALTSDEALGRPIAKYALAVLIVKGGTGMLHRVMARVGSRVSADDLHSQIRLIQSVPAPARYGFAPGFQGVPIQDR
jgi:hypothetical protein